MPFQEICNFDHDPTSVTFNQDPRISYAYGPAVTGGAPHPPPWNTKWVSWVSASGIRIGIGASVTLPNEVQGNLSSLWSNPPKGATQIAMGFDPEGLLAIALQTDSTTIKVRWFTDPSGTFDQAEFEGISPAFISNAPYAISDSLGYPDLGLLYLKEQTPRVIYARLERDGFNTEYILNPNLQANMSTLINGYVQGGKGILYGRDSVMRDVTLTSAQYAILLQDDKTKLSISLNRGNYAASAKSISISAITHREHLSISLAKGLYSMPIVVVSPLSGDAASLTVGIQAGVYS